MFEPQFGKATQGRFSDSVQSAKEQTHQFWTDLSLRSKVVMAIFALLAIGALIYNSSSDRSSSDTESGKVRAAVAAQYSCIPSLSDIRYFSSDDSGTVYFVGCGSWIYSAFISPQGQIKVQRHSTWNGL